MGGRNGLANHGPYTGPYAPDKAQRAHLRRQYKAWAPDLATAVYDQKGHRIKCFAWLDDSGTVRCEVRAFMGYFGLPLVGEAPELSVVCHGQEVALDAPELGCNLTVEGWFCRGNVRGLAGALGLGCDFSMADDGHSAIVRLRD